MNQYIQNLNRIEFLITLACTGHCRHCSEGEHSTGGRHIDGKAAAEAVCRLGSVFSMDSLMTFGGEPLLYPEEVCSIHSAGREAGIPKRQLITNGYFHNDKARIKNIAGMLAESGVNDIALSVDAFHQETIPLEPVKWFAEAVQGTGIRLRTHPAWLADREADNPYNSRTHEILREFEDMGIAASEGNIIFPKGNALKYLKEYFDLNKEYEDPYEEDPEDIRAVCVSPDGSVLGGNLYEKDILDILKSYKPEGCEK